MEYKKQQKHNLLYDNPIDNRGTFMSKHSGSAPFKHQGYNSRLDDSLGSKHGSKNQSMKSRRNESEAMEHHFGHKKFSSNKHSHKKKAETTVNNNITRTQTKQKKKKREKQD